MPQHLMPFGTRITPRGVRFALWAPSANEVTLICDGKEHPMPDIGKGWRTLIVEEAKVGSSYAFRIDDKLEVPDPASRFLQNDENKQSLVIDPEAFNWTDGNWQGRPWQEAVFYETHVGTATEAGTYHALAGKLQELRDNGITAIELLPLAATSGKRNWGYDGVLLFAPHRAYGSPDELKALINHAHHLGLMVTLDVVYNHFGPSGNYLPRYAASFFTEQHQTPWGAAMNFASCEAKHVREFFVHNALYWLEEFHFDGLRFDAVHAIIDDSKTHILAEIAARVRQSFPYRQIHLVLENEHNKARWLVRDDRQHPIHFDAQWNDDIHHCWHRLLTGENESYYKDFGGDTIARLGRCLAEGFAYQGEISENLGYKRGEVSKGLPPDAFVAFLQNHDQIGNRAFGERLSCLAQPTQLELARAMFLLSPQIPLLFMGEDWGTKKPFQFFVDFANDPNLAKSVREGRRKEFVDFKAFESNSIEAIPDPTASETFLRSKLDWNEKSVASFRAIAETTKHLLNLRSTFIVPLLKSGFESSNYQRIETGGLRVTWIFAAGSLHFLANFGPGELTLPYHVEDQILWSNLGRDELILRRDETISLKPWLGLISKGNQA